jgi:ubiquitin carboxyl-terminal hydrolase 10
MSGPPGSKVVSKRNKRKNNQTAQSTPVANAETENANDEKVAHNDGTQGCNAQQIRPPPFQPPRQERVYVEVSPVTELYEQLLRGASSSASTSGGMGNRNRKPPGNDKRRPFALQRDFTEQPYPRGMVNNSNFCFMNSILQSLLFIPAFAQLAVSVCCDTLARECCPTLTIFGNWALQYWKPGCTRLAIVAPVLMPRNKAGTSSSGTTAVSLIPNSQRALDGSVQEDAQEFLQKLLECIQRELVLFEEQLGRESEVATVLEERGGGSSPASARKGWTVVKGKEKLAVREHVDVHGQSQLLSAIFGGTLESHLQGKQRQRHHVSVLVEKFFCVPVDINFAAECTMEQALEHTFTSETIYDSEREKNLKKTLRFGQLPSILLLQLRRWAMTREGELVKLDNVVHLKRALQIPRSICGDETLDNAARSYRLLSVVCHRGDTVGRGHYVTYLVQHAASPDVMKVQQKAGKASEAEAVHTAPPSTSVILCNDANISIAPAKSMEKESIYFLVYQRMC